MKKCAGPNFNKKVIILINEPVIQVNGRGLMGVRTCNLHKVRLGD